MNAEWVGEAHPVRRRSTPVPKTLWLAPLVLAACGPAPATRSVPAPARAAPPPCPAPAVATPAPVQTEPVDPGPAIAGVVCGARSPCRLLEALPAGRDAGGGELVVARVALFEPPGIGDDFEKRQAGACDAYEHWLVVLAGGSPTEPRRLLSICNDGYGASGVGEDSVQVSEGSFVHSQHGGSAWRWEESVSLSLSPLRPRYVQTASYWNLGLHFARTRFDWDHLEGRRAWYTPRCGAQAPDEPSDGFAIGGELDPPPPYASAFELVPAVTLDDAFDPAVTALGGCGARIDSGGERGFVIEGAPGEPGDAALSVVANPDGTRLVIEIADDAFTPSPHGDRLELWVRDGTLPAFGSHCIQPSPEPVVRWDVDLSGRVRRVQGRTAERPPRVRVLDAEGGKKRLVIERARPSRVLTVAYADSDDGAAVERRIATSLLRKGDPDSLGELHPIARTDAICEVRRGRLEPALELGYAAPEP